MGVDIKLNFDELLRPYRKGGTESNPIERTLNTICNALVYKNRIPVHIVGAILLEVFVELANGLEFKGDGSYGSSGSELFQEIRNRCIKMATNRNQQEVIDSILSENTCLRTYCSKRTKKLEKLTRWKRFSRSILKPRGIWRI